LGAAQITLFLVSALANYAYGSMYKGTRGYLLSVAFQYIGTQTQRLANAGAYAKVLGDMLAARGESEAQTETLRNKLFDALVQFRLALYHAIATLKGYGDQYSALGKRIDWGHQLELKEELGCCRWYYRRR